MKKTIFLIAFLLASSLALAEGKPQPTPQQVGPNAVAGAAAGALALSASSSLSSAGANSHASNTNTQQVTNGDTTVNAGTGDRGNTYVLPAPALTVVPSSNGGIVTNSHAVNLLLFSWSKSEQSTDKFVAGERLIAQYEALCQFETASMLRQRQYALVDPSFRELPAQPGVVNMTREQCAAQRR